MIDDDNTFSLNENISSYKNARTVKPVKENLRTTYQRQKGKTKKKNEDKMMSIQKVRGGKTCFF